MHRLANDWFCGDTLGQLDVNLRDCEFNIQKDNAENTRTETERK